jgi:hypothetical protein
MRGTRCRPALRSAWPWRLTRRADHTARRNGPDHAADPLRSRSDRPRRCGPYDRIRRAPAVQASAAAARHRIAVGARMMSAAALVPVQSGHRHAARSGLLERRANALAQLATLDEIDARAAYPSLTCWHRSRRSMPRRWCRCGPFPVAPPGNIAMAAVPAARGERRTPRF